MKQILIQFPRKELLSSEKFWEKREVAFITIESKERVDEVSLSEYQKRNGLSFIPREALKDKKTVTEVEFIPLAEIVAEAVKVFPDLSETFYLISVDCQKKYFAKPKVKGSRLGGYPGEPITILEMVIVGLNGKVIASKKYESPGYNELAVIDDIIRQIEENNEIPPGYNEYLTT